MSSYHPFVKINENARIFFPRNYLVGRDISAGEYYIYGPQTAYSLNHNNRIINNSFNSDCYVILYDGDAFCLMQGEMVKSTSIQYNYLSDRVLVPGHMYKVANEIPSGSYYFVGNTTDYIASNKQSLPLVKKYAVPMFTFSRIVLDTPDEVDIIQLGEGDIKYILLENGYAYQRRDNTRLLFKVRKYDKPETNVFVKDGLICDTNPLFKLKLYKRSNDFSYYAGDCNLEIINSWQYSINNVYYFSFDFKLLSTKNVSSLTVRLSEIDNTSLNELITIDKFYSVNMVKHCCSRITNTKLFNKDIRIEVIKINGKKCVIPDSKTLFSLSDKINSCRIPYSDSDIRIIKPFSGIVGKDIPAGEYFIWGNAFFLSRIRDGNNRIIQNESIGEDCYVVLQHGDIVDFKSGRMISVKSIIYKQLTPNTNLIPKHTYKIGCELPLGWYESKKDIECFRNSNFSSHVLIKGTFELSDKYKYMRSSAEDAKYVGLTNPKLNDAVINRSRIDEFAGLISNFPFIDKNSEIEKLKKYPKLIPDIVKNLKRISNEFTNFEPKLTDEKTLFTFDIWATYDRNFYSMAKAADKAVSIRTNEDESKFFITMSGADLEEIAVITHCISESDRIIDQPDAWIYVYERDIWTHMLTDLEGVISELSQKYDENTYLRDGVFAMINNYFRDYIKSRAKKYYDAMVNECRVPSKWGHEVRLFMLTRHFVPEAVYQYRAPWLEEQSLDIYLPSQKTGIEYQGKQHYVAIDYFGGEEALHNNLIRDQKKLVACQQNGVRLLTWDYKKAVTTKAVGTFLADNGVLTHNWTSEEVAELIGNEHVDIAPQIFDFLSSPTKEPV